MLEMKRGKTNTRLLIKDHDTHVQSYTLHMSQCRKQGRKERTTSNYKSLFHSFIVLSFSRAAEAMIFSVG